MDTASALEVDAAVVRVHQTVLDEPDHDRRVACALGKPGDDRVVSGQRDIFADGSDGIAGEVQLGKDDQVSALPGRLVDRLFGPGQVLFYISENAVDLRQRDAQDGTVVETRS